MEDFQYTVKKVGRKCVQELGLLLRIMNREFRCIGTEIASSSFDLFLWQEFSWPTLCFSSSS